jgi:hypothetical protein
MKIKLGDEVRCVITDYQGIATAKVEYINGEIEYAVTPRTTKNGAYPRAEYLSSTRLEKVSDGVHVPKYARRLGFGAPEDKK